MKRFQVTSVDGNNQEAGTKNEVQLNAYNLYSPSNPISGKFTNTNSDVEAARKFSFAQLTREALPRLENYRRSLRALKRPSLGILHGEDFEINQEVTKEPEASVEHHGIKLGWIQGVLIPCLLNIWGVMLFLRLAWVVAQAGIAQTLLIIFISFVVCVITTLSLSAISTNGEVKGGGVYFIISRSLGPEFGASVGVVFAFANAVAASMNTIGFCDSMNDLLKSYGVKIIDGGVNDTRIIGTVALVIMIVICAVGMEWESKAQNFLIAIIVAAIFNFIIGSMIGPKSDEAMAEGFVGMSGAVFLQNWGSNYKFSEGLNQNFFSVFAIFFPSVTGLQAGANISGDLKDPASSIPKGTLLALLISATSYVVFVLFAGSAAVREASGNTTDLINGSIIDVSCTFGLQNSYTVMQLMAAWGPLIYAGCFAATLSTALTNLLSVPRLIQALGRDRIYPGLIFFSKGIWKKWGTVSWLPQLNLIAPLISNFYLASYALINFCTFHAAFIKPLGWRPTFKVYNAWLSLFGFALCVGIMFLIDWLSSLITFTIIFALYLIVVYRKPDVNWGSSTQAQTYKTALHATYRLQNIGDHVKNYRPQVLVLAGSPQIRPAIVDLANLITKNNSLMIVGNVVSPDISHKRRTYAIKEGHKWLQARKIKAFYDIVQNNEFDSGVRALIQTSGIGKLAPNIVLMGYKANWRTSPTSELLSYFNSMHNAFDNRMGLAILRMPKGMDYSYLNLEVNNDLTFSGLDSPTITQSHSSLPATGDLILSGNRNLMHADSNLNLAGMASSQTTITTPQPPPLPSQKRMAELKAQEKIIYSTQGGSTVPKEVLDDLGYFHLKKSDGQIDVWWLYDDGGLTILIPYILSLRSHWSGCKIRVFALTNHKMELEIEERNMANLLHKLRIDYSTLTMLQGMQDPPKQSTIDFHMQILDGFREGQNNECFVPETELETLEKKTHRQLRLRELLLEHSKDASLVVMSLPMPRKDAVSAPLYMSWLELLTNDMPPFLLIRGNQCSVLTFYS
ncbi:hypothetical protein HA402_006188 [Bradysia odoriphaga]|nr:hypothetical protein HA402_006188 [Bradysia odoriphaga]